MSKLINYICSNIGLLCACGVLSAQGDDVNPKTTAAIERFKELGFYQSPTEDHVNYERHNRDSSIRNLIYFHNLDFISDVKLAKLPVFPRAFSLQINLDTLTPEGFAELERQKNLHVLYLDGKKNLKKFIPVFEKLKSVKCLAISDQIITPAILDGIAKMPALVELSITESKTLFSKIENARAIGKMKNIRTLDLSYTGFSGLQLLQIDKVPYTALILDGCVGVNSYCIINFVKMQSLKNMGLAGTSILDSDVISLAESLKLVELDISDTPITNKCLNTIKNMKSLRLFTASNTKIDDDGLKEFQEMKQLVALELRKTKITGAGMVYLKDLSNLTYLNVSENAIDDKGIEQLHGLKNLKYLALGKTKMTKTGLAKLKAALPKCVISNSGEMYLKD